MVESAQPPRERQFDLDADVLPRQHRAEGKSSVLVGCRMSSMAGMVGGALQPSSLVADVGPNEGGTSMCEKRRPEQLVPEKWRDTGSSSPTFTQWCAGQAAGRRLPVLNEMYRSRDQDAEEHCVAALGGEMAGHHR